MGSLDGSSGTPWLPLCADWRARNVAELACDAGSMLALHRALLALRRAHPALVTGELSLLDADGDVLAYERRSGGERLLIALNLGHAAQELSLPAWARGARVLLSTLAASAKRVPAVERLVLRPDEGLVLAPSLPPPAA